MTSILVQRGCNPTQDFPLQQTVQRATRAELAEIRAFWELQPQRVFKADEHDTRIPVAGTDVIDGKRALALDIIGWAEGLKQATARASVQRATLSGTWRAALLTPTVIHAGGEALLEQARSSYSADCIAKNTSLRTPLVYGQRRWVCVEFDGLASPPVAICREIVPCDAHTEINPALLQPVSSDLYAGREVRYADATWLMTCGTLVVTDVPTEDAADEVVAAANIQAEILPVVAEPELDVATPVSAERSIVHDGGLVKTAIRQFSGDLARWQLRLREPFRYEGRSWSCLDYTPYGAPQHLTSVMCREVVPLIDVDASSATAALCGDVQDEWTGKQLRDPSGSFLWLVTPRELIVMRDKPAAVVASGEIPRMADATAEPVAVLPAAQGSDLAVQHSLF